MKMLSKSVCKILSTALVLTSLGGIVAAAPVSSLIGANVTVSAASTASSPVVTVGDFQYILYSDKTAKVVGYTGTKDLSATNFSMPTVIYAKDISTTWEYNQYISSYNITQMQAGIFSGCKFKTLTLPRYLQAITGGFTGAEIGAFFIDDNNSYFSSTSYSGAYALYNKSNTTLYAYPSNPELYSSGFGTATKGFPSTLTRIEDQAFAGSKLYTVTVPSSVTYMGDRVFTGSNVHYVTFEGNAPTFRFMPSSTIPDHGTFEGASSLYQITIKGKNGAYNTDSYGVIYNKDMTKLVLVPQGKTSAFNVASTCTEIGDYAFYHSNANGPVIYDQVKTIDSYAFSGVKSNFKVYCLKDTPTDTYVKNNSIPYTYIYEYTTSGDGVTITKYNGPYSSPGVLTSINGKDVVAIGNEAFRGNTSLTAVYLYSPIASIGDYAFYGCTNMTKVSMPSTLTKIGERSFYNCTKLASLSLPAKLTNIGTYAFGYTALESVKIPNSVTTISTAAFYGCSKLSSVDLGTGVKTIGSYAFENTALTSQYIPKNVTSIGSNAFGYEYSDSTHTRVTFDYISGYPDSHAQTYAINNNITFKSVLDYSTGSDGNIIIDKYTGTDTNVVIPSTIDGKPVTGIAGYAFNGTNVTSVTLPSSMTKLDGYAFYGASKLTSVTIPSSITSIGSYAFEFCTSLKSITIPGTVKSIGTGAFYGCTALSKVTFNNGLQSVGKYAFTNTALTAVTIPKTVTSINEHAFGYDYKNSTYSPVDTFTLTGYVDTAAETYALNNTHITFIPQYETFVNTSSVDKNSITLGEKITVSASAAGGKKSYQYAVYYKKNNGSYTTLQNLSSNAKIEFTPESSGTYTVMVTASDYRNVMASKTFDITVFAPPLANESAYSSDSIELGESVVITGKASGGEGSYQYEVKYNLVGQEEWVTVQEFSSDSAIKVTPPTAGDYIISVAVKDSNGTLQTNYYSITVKSTVTALVNESTISKTSITLGESITLTGKASGGTTPYLYGVYYKKTTSTTWSTAQSYKSNNKVVVKPAAAVKYDVCIKVKDATGKIEKKYFVVDVVKPLTNNSTLSADTIKKGETVIATGKATGGTTPYLYGVYYKKTTSTTWSTAQSYKSNSKVVIKPAAAVKYDICIKVKDATGKIEKKYFELTVTK